MSKSLLAKELIDDVMERMPKEVFMLKKKPASFFKHITLGAYTNLEKIAEDLYEIGYGNEKIGILEDLVEKFVDNDTFYFGLCNRHTNHVTYFIVDKLYLNEYCG